MNRVNKLAKDHFMGVLAQVGDQPINKRLAQDEFTELAKAHLEDNESGPVVGQFTADCYSVKWDLLKDGRIKFMPKKLKRFTLKEAAEYVNLRLAHKWVQPTVALRHSLNRGKIKISLHGQRHNEISFTLRELDRFIAHKNGTPPRGKIQLDLSKYSKLFGYHSDSHIGKAANCSASTVARYRERHNIPNFHEAALARIEAVRDRLGREPAGKLAQEIQVNRMTLVKYMKKNEIPAYKRK